MSVRRMTVPALVLAPLFVLSARDARAANVTLPATGVTVDLPGAWSVQSTATLDTVERTEPATPFIGIGFALMKADTECETRLVRMAQSAGGDMIPRPSFVPNGYFKKSADVSIKYGADAVRHEVVACAVTGAGAVHASIQFDVPLSTEDFNTIRVVLDRVARAVDRVANPPAAPSSSSGDDDSSSDRAPAHAGGPYELAGIMIKPANDKSTTGFGGTFGMDLIDGFGDGPIGFAYNLSGWIGYESAGRIPFDTKFGIGLRLRLLPQVTLIPLVSLGIDGAGGAPDTDFNVKGYGYWDVGGRVRLRFSGQAFELGFDRITRGSFFKGPDADIGREYRGQIKYLISGKIEPWIGLRYIDYEGTTPLGGTTTGPSGAGAAFMFGFKI